MVDQSLVKKASRRENLYRFTESANVTQASDVCVCVCVRAFDTKRPDSAYFFPLVPAIIGLRVFSYVDMQGVCCASGVTCPPAERED